MLATKSRRARPKYGYKPRQDGVAAVEFALVVIVFFTIVFGIMEIARALYMFNTLAEVTRSAARAAASTSFKDANALDLARKRAVFNETSGELPFGAPITYKNIRIEYLYLPLKATDLQLIPAGALPSCPAQNRRNCIIDPNSASCIRAVQARICEEGQAAGACTPVTFVPLISLIKLPLKLPTSLTIVSTETLGYRAGDPCS
jgi:hypothetical protein